MFKADSAAAIASRVCSLAVARLKPLAASPAARKRDLAIVANMVQDPYEDSFDPQHSKF